MKDLTERIGTTIAGIIIVPIILLNTYDGCVDKIVYFDEVEKFKEFAFDDEIAELILVPENFMLMKDSKSDTQAFIFEVDGRGYHKFGPLFKKDDSWLGISFHKGVKKKLNLEMKIIGAIDDGEIVEAEGQGSTIKAIFLKSEDGVALGDVVYFKKELTEVDEQLVQSLYDNLE